MNLCGYTRVSSATQIDGFGLSNQREAIEGWAERAGHTIAHWCEDAGVSGLVLDRPGLDCAIDAVRSGEADGIVCARLDRLARLFTAQEALLGLFWSLGATIYTADTGEVTADDPDDPMRTAIRQVMGVFSQLDRAMLVKRLRDGRRAKKAAGGRGEGVEPYGATEAEQAGVERIRQLRDEGKTWQAIADAMNVEGFPSSTGAKWYPTTARRVGVRNGQR
jgi:DNA invertase Pin-like site-specific DNA recombinase